MKLLLEVDSKRVTELEQEIIREMKEYEAHPAISVFDAVAHRLAVHGALLDKIVESLEKLEAAFEGELS